MKRIICFIFSLLILFSFAGCNSNKTKDTRTTLETEASGVDIIKYAKKGKIPELNYSLGDDAEEIIAGFEDSESDIFSIMDGDEYTTVITPDNANLIYETDAKKKEIKYIVSFGKSYGFENEMDPNTVASVMESKGYSATLKDIPQALSPFVPGSTGCDCLSYNIDGKSLNFVFDSNYLAATILYEK